MSKDLFSAMIDTYRPLPALVPAEEMDFDNVGKKILSKGECVSGKAWLSSYIYTDTPESYTPFRPLFKGHLEDQGISGISWLSNYMPVTKQDITWNSFKLAFLYPYRAPGFCIKLSFMGNPVEDYNRYMSLMYSKEEFPAHSFLIEDDGFKPFPVLILKDVETETIVEFKGILNSFQLNSSEILSRLDHTARQNYSLFLEDELNPLFIDTTLEKTYIKTNNFKDFKNSRYNVKYGTRIREFKFEAQHPLPAFIPDIPHALCGIIGEINQDFKSPAFSSTPNYGIKKSKAISSCCGPVLFNYVNGNIISLSTHFNLSDKARELKLEKTLQEFEGLLKEQLTKYMKDVFKTDIKYSEI